MEDEHSRSSADGTAPSSAAAGHSREEQPIVGKAVHLANLEGLEPDGVLLLGTLDGRIVAVWSTHLDGNLEVVLTGKQRRHYLERHPAMAAWELGLPELLAAPDLVCRNRADPQVAIFYRRAGDDTWLRAAVVMQPEAGRFKHSVLSFRLARWNEVQRSRAQEVWSLEVR